MSYCFADLASTKIFAILCSAGLLYYMCKLFRGPRAPNTFLHARMRLGGCIVSHPSLNVCLTLLHTTHFPGSGKAIRSKTKCAGYSTRETRCNWMWKWECGSAVEKYKKNVC